MLSLALTAVLALAYAFTLLARRRIITGLMVGLAVLSGAPASVLVLTCLIAYGVTREARRDNVRPC